MYHQFSLRLVTKGEAVLERISATEMMITEKDRAQRSAQQHNSSNDHPNNLMSSQRSFCIANEDRGCSDEKYDRLPMAFFSLRRDLQKVELSMPRLWKYYLPSAMICVMSFWYSKLDLWL
jgi:hypothetical protein